MAHDEEHRSGKRVVVGKATGETVFRGSADDSLREPEGDHPLRALLSQGETLTGKRLERYEIGPLLGRGALGHVYRAHDTMLNRPVALKILYGQERHWTKNVLREARAQAAVDHEHICKVFDAGYAGGLSFIAMQFIDGQTLRKAAAGMTLRQKVMLMRDVAQAISAAHRFGLIHRDIKPTNIMVETGANDRFKPYVMDFGLARELEASAASTSQSVKIRGTPSYMPPEQAQPETYRVDTRSDVYSLGATLYELVTGRPPFEGPSAIPIMLKVVREPVKPPRQLRPGTPRDLELILLTCLAKDPRDRFSSAGALVRELDRFLDGDPIKCRGRSPFYILSKRVLQHKSLSLALLAVLLLMGFSIRSRILAGKRNQLFERFLDEVQGIEWQLRVNHMMPIHDIRPEIEAIRARIEAIAGDMKKMGRLATGPGHYAIGRGQLDLGNLDEARFHLEKAMAEAVRNPGVSYALGEALGKLYERRLGELGLLEKGTRSEKEKRQLKESLLLPALAALKRGAGERRISDSAYIEAQIAFYEEDFDLALERSRQAHRDAPWFYEALALEARIHLARGKALADRGEYEQARSAYEQGGTALAEALAIAHSDLALYLDESTRWQLMMDLEFRGGGDVAGALAEILRCTDAAATIDPDRSGIYTRRAYAYYRMAEYRFYILGQSPAEDLDNAIEAGHRALDLQSDDAMAFNHLGLAYNLLAEYEIEQREDPTASLKTALSYNEKALAIYPTLASMINNQGVLYWQIGEIAYRNGADPLPDLEKSRACFHRVLELDASQALANNNLGLSFWTQGEYLISRGEDAIEVLDKAVASFQKAIDINRFAYAFTNQAEVLTILANRLIDRGRDPRDHLSRAREATENAYSINPNDPSHLLLRSQIARTEARWRMVAGESPQAGLAEAERAMVAYDTPSGETTEVARERARIWLQWATWHLARNSPRDARKAMETMDRYVAHLRKIDGEDEQARAMEAALQLLRAEMETAPQRARQGTATAAADLKAILDQAPWLYGEFGSCYSRAKERLEELPHP